MAISREFLGWKKPFLESTADWLSERFPDLNLENIVLVLPGGRAEKLLLEILLERAEQNGKVLIPPRTRLTLGRLPEFIISAQGIKLSDFQRRLVWAEALKNLSAAELSGLMPFAEDIRDLAGWLGLAEQIDKLYVEISGAALTFSDMGEKSLELSDILDDQRWEILSEIFNGYQKLLADHSLVDHHQERFGALERGSFEITQEIVLVAAADLNVITKKLLSKIKGDLTALINAPDSHTDLFDQFGTVLSSKWLAQEIDIQDQQIEVVFDPGQQAQAVSAFLASLNGKYSAEEITIGLGDEKIQPFISQDLLSKNVTIRYAAGTPLSETSPFRLLKAISKFLSSGDMVDFGSLVRCFDLQKWLERRLLKDEGLSEFPGGVLSSLDRYQDWHLQAKVNEDLAGRGEDPGTANMVKEAVLGLLSKFSEEAESVKEWGENIGELFSALYENSPLLQSEYSSRIIKEFCSSLSSVLADLADLEAQGVLPVLRGSEVLTLLLRELSERSLAPLPDSEAIELLGWLELQLDTAPAMVITGFNEGLVPKSVNSDPFLPDSLRRKLGLVDNERRYARDAFILTTMLNSKKELRIVSGRRGSEAEPLSPSRLLFACSGRKTAERVKAFLSEEEGSYAEEVGDGLASSTSYAIPPKPEPLSKPIEVMSVTGFKDYITSPYRFYLKHVLRLKTIDDLSLEMNPLSFGILTHDILNDFGKSEVAGSIELRIIRDFLLAALERRVKELFGLNVLPAVMVQVAQLRSRLESFARWQAAWVKEGWQIKHSEYAFSEKDLALDLPDGKMGVRGRIDRVDYNPRSRTWIVIDYKTGDKENLPDKQHRLKREWVDLQLPIYEYYLRSKGISEEIKCGYITVCADLDKIGLRLAKWSREDLKDAEAFMIEVAKKVRSGDFNPTDRDKKLNDEFAALCGKGQFLTIGGEEER